MKISELLNEEAPAFDFTAFGKLVANVVKRMDDEEGLSVTVSKFANNSAEHALDLHIPGRPGPFRTMLKAEAKKMGIKPIWTVEAESGGNETYLKVALPDDLKIDFKAFKKGYQSVDTPEHSLSKRINEAEDAVAKKLGINDLIEGPKPLAGWVTYAGDGHHGKVYLFKTPTDAKAWKKAFDKQAEDSDLSTSKVFNVDGLSIVFTGDRHSDFDEIYPLMAVTGQNASKGMTAFKKKIKDGDIYGVDKIEDTTVTATSTK